VDGKKKGTKRKGRRDGKKIEIGRKVP